MFKEKIVSKKFYKGPALDSEAEQERVESLYKLLTEYFTEEWLIKKDNHPIQILWKRVDQIAIMELRALAQSIECLALIDPKWVKRQVEQSKSKDLNNCKGAILELFCLGMMNGHDHPIQPTKLNQPGYDGILKLNSGTDLRVSIKNYGISEAQRKFEESAEIIENIIVELLKKYNYPPSLIVIESPIKYPTDTDWINLEESLEYIFQTRSSDVYLSNDPQGEEVNPAKSIIHWTIKIAPFSDDVEKYHSSHKTFTLLISSPFHDNEYLNIYSKIEKACKNLEKHSAYETDTLLNTLFIHIPISISIEKCYEWVTGYFLKYPSIPISIVYLYQPAFVSDTETNKESIHYCFNILFRTEEIKETLPTMNFTIPTHGTLSDKPAQNVFVTKFPDGKTETSPMITDRYLYQKGNHYLTMEADGMGKYIGSLEKVGTGIFRHLVIDIPGEPEGAVISLNLPQKDILLII